MAGATHLDTNISFDPRVISYDDLLKVLLTVRNPTTRNKQGPDEGPQYRSIIFHRTPEQKTAALAAIRKMTAARTWKAPIVTEVKPFKIFYVAEDYHLDYYLLHPDEAYCRFVIAPKIEQLRAKFARLLK
jgi:peptide-methionine (S)-S-oxide reductase